MGDRRCPAPDHARETAPPPRGPRPRPTPHPPAPPPLLPRPPSPPAFDPAPAVDARAPALLLEAARRAPSAGNSQPWGFLVARPGEPDHVRLLPHLAPSSARWARDAGL